MVRTKKRITYSHDGLTVVGGETEINQVIMQIYNFKMGKCNEENL